jgi:hypothetical protein
MKTKRTSRGQRGSVFAVCASVAAAWISLGLPAAVWAQELFVPNRAGNSVDVYRRAAVNTEAPRRRLVGAATALDLPQVVVVDAVNNELVVLSVGQLNAPSITVYERTASGNIAPIRTLTGAATGLSAPLGLAVDSVNNELFVLNFDSTSMTSAVTVYSRTASGNTAPIRTLAGAATALNQDSYWGYQGLVVDTANNELVVANGSNNSITVYVRTASGNTAPIRTLAGGGLPIGPCALAVDAVNNELFVSEPTNETVRVYSRTATDSSSWIRLFDAFGGGPQPCGLSLDSVNNELFVTEPGQFPPHRVSVYSPTATIPATPIRSLQLADPGSAPAAVTTSPAPNAHTTMGLYRPSDNNFYLRNSNTYGFGEVVFSLGFAAPGDVPIAGDWTGDGVTKTGFFNPSDNFFSLATSNASNSGVLFVSPRGAAGDLPVVGDWDGNGVTTTGLFRPTTNEFFLWNSNSFGVPDIVVAVGAPGDLPLAGDWDGDGTTTIGLFRPSTNTFYLWNNNTAAGPDVVVSVGAPGDLPIVGDWDGNGTTTIGLFRPSTNTFYLWNSFSASAPDIAIPYGAPNDLPVVGNWDGL